MKFVTLVILSFVILVTNYCKPIDDEDEPVYNERGEKVCQGDDPCGWAAYNISIQPRKIRFFIKNTCVCPNETTCLSDQDDTRLEAYIHRCK